MFAARRVHNSTGPSRLALPSLLTSPVASFTWRFLRSSKTLPNFASFLSLLLQWIRCSILPLFPRQSPTHIVSNNTVSVKLRHLALAREGAAPCLLVDALPLLLRMGIVQLEILDIREAIFESLFCYDKSILEELIETPVGLSLANREIGDKQRCCSCEAKGAVLCLTCTGSGLYVDSILESQGIIVKVRCLGCGGTGNIMCSDCGGRGHV